MPTFVAYGHPLYRHTHSYIHHGFVRAFGHLNWTTHWVDDDEEGAQLVATVPAGTWILTEGQVDQRLPVRADCFYLLHHCNVSKYLSLPRDHVICLEVNLLGRPQVGVRLSDVSRWTIDEQGVRHLHTCWATDLLPHEVQANMDTLTEENNPRVTFIGYMNACPTFGNEQEIMSFVRPAQQAGYQWTCHKDSFAHPVTNEDQQRLIRESRLAPAIVGHWQQREGYIPCRIFKNISYGSLGITNSAFAQDLSQGRLVYDSDGETLFALAHKKIQEGTSNLLLSQMEWVRDHQTYVHRIHDLFKMVTTGHAAIVVDR